MDRFSTNRALLRETVEVWHQLISLVYSLARRIENRVQARPKKAASEVGACLRIGGFSRVVGTPRPKRLPGASLY